MGSPPLTKHFVACIALTPLLTVGVSQNAVAQRLTCVTVRPGETATGIARRLTGATGYEWQSGFQIVNPYTAQLVPKSTYDRILVGWHACIVDDATVGNGLMPTQAGIVEGVWRGSHQTVPVVDSVDGNFVLWGMLVASIALASHSAERYLSYRASVLATMRQFGEAFVHEFEQPLIDREAQNRPIESRFRFTPSRSQFDVLLAPNAGRRYPNLTDHKKNVEYDVTRVLQLLEGQPFVTGRPYSRGRWVVVPFQLKVGITKAGGQ